MGEGKPILRLFADYCCGFALWNHHSHDILDGSVHQLYALGISHSTVALLETMVTVHDWEDSHEEPTQEFLTTYKYLEKITKQKLDKEIGHKFIIQIGSR